MSDKSRNGGDAKKVKETAKSTFSLSDEVFSDGLNSSECAKILLNCLRNIENQLKEFSVVNEETKKQIKVTDSLKFFSNKFDGLERENKIKKTGKNKRTGGNDWYFNGKKKSDEWCRWVRTILPQELPAFAWCSGNENENIDDIVLKTMSEELDIEIEKNDQDTTHRTGSRNRKEL